MSMSQAEWNYQQAVTDSTPFAIRQREIASRRAYMANIFQGRRLQNNATLAGHYARMKWESRNCRNLIRIFA